MSNVVGYLLKRAQGPGNLWDPQEIVFRDYVNPLLQDQVPSQHLQYLVEAHRAATDPRSRWRNDIPAEHKEYWIGPGSNNRQFRLRMGPGNPAYYIRQFQENALKSFAGAAAGKAPPKYKRFSVYGNPASDVRSALIPSWITAAKITTPTASAGTRERQEALVRLFANAPPDVKRQVVQMMRFSLPVRDASLRIPVSRGAIAQTSPDDRSIEISSRMFERGTYYPVNLVFTHEAQHLRNDENESWSSGPGIYLKDEYGLGRVAKKPLNDETIGVLNRRVLGEYGPQMAEMATVGRLWQALANNQNVPEKTRQLAQHVLRQAPMNPYGTLGSFMRVIGEKGLDPANTRTFNPDLTFTKLLEFPTPRDYLLSVLGLSPRKWQFPPQHRRVADYVRKYDPQVKNYPTGKGTPPDKLRTVVLNQEAQPAARALLWDRAQQLESQKTPSVWNKGTGGTRGR